MKNEDEIKSVFKGSVVEAGLVKEVLEENGIGAMIKNTLSEGYLKKWMTDPPYNSYMVYVESAYFEKACELIDKYFKASLEDENTTE